MRRTGPENVGIDHDRFGTVHGRKSLFEAEERNFVQETIELTDSDPGGFWTKFINVSARF